MIIVRKIKDGSRCDMCFAKPRYEITADDRYAERPAFVLHLCREHAIQLEDAIYTALEISADGVK